MTLDELIDINDQALNDPPSPNYENVDFQFDSSTDAILANINDNGFDSSTDDILANIIEDDLRSTQGYESNEVPAKFGKNNNLKKKHTSNHKFMNLAICMSGESRILTVIISSRR